MDKILTNNIWAQVSKELKKKNKIAALAYVSSDEFVTFKEGDLLICDASNKAISTGETSAKILRQFFRNGAEIFNYPNLHSKVILFGNNALVGSNNLSSSSAYILREIALLTNRTQIISQIKSFIYQLKDDSKRINESYLRIIEKIPVKKYPIFSKKKSNSRKINIGNRCWIVSTHPLDEDKYLKEEKFVEKAVSDLKKLKKSFEDISWIRWNGNSRFRKLAKEGDTIIIMHHESEKRIRVFQPVSILKKQNIDKWTRFYYEETEDEGINWSTFAKKVKQIGLRKTISKNSVKEISSSELSAIEEILLMKNT